MSENTQVFASLSHNDVAERLLCAKSVLILFHVNPDGDAVGSAFALRQALVSLGKSAWCISACQIPERLLFASEDAQDDVLIDSIPEDFEPDLTVSVDTASPSQLGALYEIYKDKIDIMIDHHGKGTPYADNLVCPEASSCGEVLCSVLDIDKNTLIKPDSSKFVAIGGKSDNEMYIKVGNKYEKILGI
jgi:phosphoesterase RecJ-like protein